MSVPLVDRKEDLVELEHIFSCRRPRGEKRDTSEQVVLYLHTFHFLGPPFHIPVLVLAVALCIPHVE